MRLLLIVLPFLFLTGCYLSPDPNLPKVEVPQDATAENTEILKDRWWEGYGDPNLNAFMEELLQNNNDLQIAALRVLKYQDILDLKRAEQFPNVNAYGDAIHQQTSDEVHTQNQGDIYDTYDLGGVATFELDLWGKLRNAKKAAFENMMQMSYNKEAVRLRVIAEGVNAYYGLKSSKALYEIAKQTYETRKNSYAYRKKQYDVGTINENVLLNEESLMESAYEISIWRKNVLEVQKTAAAVLLGKEPKEVYEAMKIDAGSSDYRVDVLPVPAGLPSDILERRPDIKAAEAKVKASAFSVGSARAAYFPSIVLSGSAGYASSEIGSVFTPGAATYDIGGGLLSPILDFGRISAQVEGAKKDQKIALAEYNSTVREAFGEVRDALNTYASNKKRLASYEKRYLAVNKNVKIAKDRFDTGFGSYLELLDATRQEFTVALSKEEIKYATLKSLTELYVSLGGGFKSEAEGE